MESATGKSDGADSPPQKPVADPVPKEAPKPETAPPELVDQVAKRVEAATRPDPTVRPRLKALAARWGSWLLPAVKRLESKARREPVGSPLGFLVRTLEGFQRDGGPPADEPTAEDMTAERQARYQAKEDAIRALLEETDE